jgi:hypothetical protein
MNVPPKYHFVAHHAEVINQICGKHNGVTVTFPQDNSNSRKVLIKGHKDYVEKVKNEIDNIIDLVSCILTLIVLSLNY